MAVELGKVDLGNLSQVAVREQMRVVRHGVPGMAGDLSQVLGRPSVEVELHGAYYGADAGDRLGKLRDLYLKGEPVDFFADAVGQGYFAQVLILSLHLEQKAGELDQFSFACEVMEYVKPPEPAAPDLLSGLDTSILDEAAGFMDDVQNAIDQVSKLADVLGNIPSFGNPTTRLGAMPSSFLSLAGGNTLDILKQTRDSL
jgi:hypothetical protein